jgi:hypothetical protein
MLKITVNSKASGAMARASSYVDTLPNRIAQAQAVGLQRAATRIDARLKSLYRAGGYLNTKIESSGPLGVRMVITPHKIRSIDGWNAGIGAAILLTGKKGGGYIRPRRKKAMRLRNKSVAAGYPKFAKKVRKVVISSKRESIKAIVRTIVIEEMKKSLMKQGFGPRGGGSKLTDVI